MAACVSPGPGLAACRRTKIASFFSEQTAVLAPSKTGLEEPVPVGTGREGSLGVGCVRSHAVVAFL